MNASPIDAGPTSRRWRPGPALLGLFAGWTALLAWSGMVSDPSRFLVPTLVAGIVVVVAGTTLRSLGAPTYAVVPAQLVLAMLCLNIAIAPGQSLFGLVPTEGSVRRIVSALNNGAATLNTYAAPVEASPADTGALLLCCGLAVLLAIDILAISLRRPPLAALPILVALSVPVSILTAALAVPVFVVVALLFLRMLAAQHLDRLLSWGHRETSAEERGAGAGPRRLPAGRGMAPLWQVSVAAVLLALLAAPLVPVSDLSDGAGDGAGGGLGAGRGYQLAVNPFIRMRRDLVEKTNTPLVFAETEARSTAYLRTTVLDDFTSTAWRPSPRELPSENEADGVFPNPPGLAPSVSGIEEEWSLQLAPGFRTMWLPLPYPIRSLDVPGVWRYDDRTLDVAYLSQGSTSRMKYRTTAFTPTITADLLDSTSRAPASVREPMTEVPEDLPDVIGERAREVTRGMQSDFAKAVALQDWFREDGGFRYSLEQRNGSGMDLLAAFVTDDRVGYCEQFAAAMAAMGRSLGIPSRVAVGFLDGSTEPDGRVLYTSDDRHAWTEMYFPGAGWVRFEPTPGQRSGASPAWTRQAQPAALPSVAPSAGASQAPAAAPEPATTEDTAAGEKGSSLPAWPLVSLLVVLVLGLGPALARGLQRRRRLAGSDPTHLAEGAWSELRATALDLGLTWPEQRSPREQARSVAGQVPAQDADLDALEGLLVRVERGRYDQGGTEGGTQTVDADLRDRTVETVGSWRRAMASSVDRHRGWRGRVWPVSLLRGWR